MVIFRICHEQKSLPVPGSMGMYMSPHSNPKYISLIKNRKTKTITVKYGHCFDIDYVTVYIPMGSTLIS